MKTNSDYIPPTVTVDIVCFSIIDNVLNVLLIKRVNEPFANELALPGGYVANNEMSFDAANRVLKDKAAVSLVSLPYYEQLYTFDSTARDPRGHAVSVTYMALTPPVDTVAINNSQSATWLPVDSLPKLAFDHKNIVALAVKRLRSKLNYTNAAFALLENEFTLTQLQSTYESVSGIKLDKRNFRKKILSTNLIESTHRKTDGVSHRPAELYRFKDNKIQEIEQFILV